MRWMYVGGTALGLLLASCVRIVDIAQPAVVKTGKSFEAVVIVEADGDTTGTVTGDYYGVLAVGLPVGWTFRGARFEGPATLKMEPLTPASGDTLPAVVGNVWFYVITDKPLDAPVFAGRRFTGNVKIRTGKTAGNYEIQYRTGGAQYDKDTGFTVEWAGETVPRHVTLE